VIGDDERRVVDRLEDLVVVLDGVGVLRVGEVSLGHVGIGTGEGGAHLLEADAVFVQRERIEFHPYGGKRAAADGDLADAAELGKFLCEHCRG